MYSKETVKNVSVIESFIQEMFLKGLIHIVMKQWSLHERVIRTDFLNNEFKLIIKKKTIAIDILSNL